MRLERRAGEGRAGKCRKKGRNPGGKKVITMKRINAPTNHEALTNLALQSVGLPFA